MVSAISSGILLPLYNFLTQGMLLSLVKVYIGNLIRFALYGKYSVLDFEVNKRPCIRSLKTRVNQDRIVNRGAGSTLVAISVSIFDRTFSV